MDASGSGAIDTSEHGTVIDRKKSRVECNYCGKVVSGSYRLKCHIGGIRGDVVPCPSAPADVVELMKNNVMESKREFGKEFGGLDQRADEPRKRNITPSSNGGKRNRAETSQASGSQNGSQEEMDFSLEDSATGHVFGSGSKRGADKGATSNLVPRKAQKCIGRFFYETGLDFAAANSPSFREMIHSTLGAGQVECKIPSFEELQGCILEDEVKEMQEYMTKIRQSWATTGCSILFDGWIDERGRNLVNFLVDCPQGPIYLCTRDISSIVGDKEAMYSLFEEIMRDVGDENVIQIVADTTTGWAGTIRKEFKHRYKGVFWAVSASHCIELILEKIGMIDSIRGTLHKAKLLTKFIHGHETVLKLMKKHTLGRDLIQPSKIRAAMPYMTLENIVSEKENLKHMFTSSEWNMLACAPREQGKRVADLVEDQSFWKEARMVLKVAIPLINLLEWIFKADKPLVGYIYETMDQAKETIKKEFDGKKSQYMPFWEIIDEIWNKHLHIPLHGAGHYLNPILYYASDFYGDEEVHFDVTRCLVQMVQHHSTQYLISRQVGKYRKAKGSFEEGKPKNRRTNIPPAMWWSSYGKQYPELQRFAIRILSQHCDGASRYGLKRTLAEMLVTNGRNPIEQQRLKDLAFVHYNLHLQQFFSAVKSGIVAEKIDPTDDWIIYERPDIVPQDGECSWMNLDRTRGAINEEGPSSLQGKTEPM